MKVGEIVRHVRSSKKLKSKNIYSQIMSRPAISKFEKGQSDTTVEKFMKILHNLNITLEEFDYFYESFTGEINHKFYYKYKILFYNKDIKKLSDLRKKLNEKYSQSKNISYLHYAALIELTINYLQNNNVSCTSFDILRNYLIECEEWTHYEIILFTNSLDYFDEDLIFLLYKRAKNKLKKRDVFNNYKNETFTLIINALVISVSSLNIKRSKFYYFELSENISDTSYKMYEKTMLIFFKEVINIFQQGYIEQANLNKLESIINIFDFLNLELKRDQCKGILNIIKNNFEKLN